MTKKDYELIAKLIKRETFIASDQPERKHTIQGIARLLASEIGHSNPKFDRKRFLASCNVQNWDARI